MVVIVPVIMPYNTINTISPVAQWILLIMLISWDIFIFHVLNNTMKDADWHMTEIGFLVLLTFISIVLTVIVILDMLMT